MVAKGGFHHHSDAIRDIEMLYVSTLFTGGLTLEFASDEFGSWSFLNFPYSTRGPFTQMGRRIRIRGNDTNTRDGGLLAALGGVGKRCTGNPK